MAGLFDSAWMKWGWAMREATSLSADLEAFIQDVDNERLIATRCDYHPNRHGFALKLIAVPPLPPHIHLRLSTVAHSYRSALDNLAWALVSRGRTPPETLNDREQRAIFFPICEERDGERGFNTLLKGTSRRPSMLPGVRRADIALVRMAQPYVRGKTNIPYHALAILAAFNNVDKHRTLQQVVFLPETFNYEIRQTWDCEITRHSPRARRRILEVGAELAYFPARRTGVDPKLKVEYEISAFPALNERLSLEDWLRNVEQAVGALLLRCADPPRAEFDALGLPHIVGMP